jgi:hypothetical protein
MFLKKKKSINVLSIPRVDILFNGTCYSIEDTLYYIKGGNVYTFYSPRAFESWRLQPVTVRFSYPVMLTTLNKGKLGFRDGTLIQNAKDGTIYLISDAKKNRLTRPLADYGFDWADVIEVADYEVQFHLEGVLS